MTLVIGLVSCKQVLKKCRHSADEALASGVSPSTGVYRTGASDIRGTPRQRPLQIVPVHPTYDSLLYRFLPVFHPSIRESAVEYSTTDYR